MLKILLPSIALVAASALVSTEAEARDFSPACASANNRALDFWIGDWKVEWRIGDGRSGQATSVVVSENGGCVIREHFRDLAGGLEGTGIYSYFAPIRAWTQTWMDNQGITLSSTGGATNEGTERFQLRLARGSDPNKEHRTVWQDVTDSGFTWLFQSRAKGAQAWTTDGTSQYRRR